MELIKTKHNGSPIDVIFDGRYFFFDGIHGLVGFVDFPDDETEKSTLIFNVVRSLAIDPEVIERTIKKERSDFFRTFNLEEKHKIKFKYETQKYVGALPYYLEIKLKKLEK